MFPLMQDGLVRLLAADPKLMELAYGRVIFESYGTYAADPAAIAAMLDQAVADMQDRARGRRTHPARTRMVLAGRDRLCPDRIGRGLNERRRGEWGPGGGGGGGGLSGVI